MPVAGSRRALIAVGLFMLAFAASPRAWAQDYKAIVAAEDRTDADRTTDKRRDPLNLLTFAAPKTGAKVLEMGAGGGYNAELLARAVGPSGKVYAQVPKESERLTARIGAAAMKNVTVLIRAFDDPVPADVKDLDLITFYFSYHDTTFLEVDRAKMNKAMFVALKPGGILTIADHSARPEDGATVGKTLHRIGEAALRAEIEAAGFKFVASADFLRHPEDKRTDVVFKNPTPVDEFVLKFQKPN